MERYQSSTQCKLCSGTVSHIAWTTRFITVLIRGKNIELGRLDYVNSLFLQRSVINGQDISFELKSPFTFTPVEAFLIHESCDLLLRQIPEPKDISPYQLFKLCQALQIDQQRKFDQDAVESPPLRHPSTRIIVSPQLDGIRLDLAGPVTSPLLRLLPPELMLSILEYLPPSAVVQFLSASKRALEYAEEFCRTNPCHFYNCVGTGDSVHDKRKLAVNLAAKSPQFKFLLDLRWQIVSKIMAASELLLHINNDSTDAKTLDPRAPFRYLDHPFGFHEATLQIPDDIEAVEIYSMKLNGKSYVCGIGVRSKTASSFYGNKTKLLSERSFQMGGIDIIGFAIDGLGIRSIQWGVPQGLLGSIGCWEGVSLKQSRRQIRIVSDALKFRQIGWSRVYPPSFSETLLMKGGHASLSGHGTVSERHYVSLRPIWGDHLVTAFGNFPVAALWFEQGIQSISIHYPRTLGQISGVSVRVPSGTHHVGRAFSTRQTTLELNAPQERLTEMDVFTSGETNLAIVFKTNHNRQSHGPNPGSFREIHKLRPPLGHHITGLYFGMNGTWITSVGLIYDP